MFEWKYLFEDKILKRAVSYTDDISNIKVLDNKVTCDISGTADYYVTATVVEDNLESISCTCPYEFYCKHEAALLYYIEDHPELLDVKSKVKDETDSILSNIDCYTLKTFLEKQLKVNDALKKDFINEFKNKSMIGKRFYQDKLEQIFENAKGREFNMHGYYNLEYIGNSLLRFIDEDIGHIISLGEYSIACDLLNFIMDKLDDDMYMNFDAWFDLAYNYKEYAVKILESDNLDELQRYEMESKIRKFSNFV